jgi:hypothetical protein
MSLKELMQQPKSVLTKVMTEGIELYGLEKQADRAKKAYARGFYSREKERLLYEWQKAEARVRKAKGLA